MPERSCKTYTSFSAYASSPGTAAPPRARAAAVGGSGGGVGQGPGACRGREQPRDERRDEGRLARLGDLRRHQLGDDVERRARTAAPPAR